VAVVVTTRTNGTGPRAWAEFWVWWLSCFWCSGCSAACISNPFTQPSAPGNTSAPPEWLAEPAQTVLPPHIEQTVQAIARLHAEHHKRAPPLQRMVDRLTAIVAQPSFIGAVTLVVIAWIAGNLLLARFTGWRFDGVAFPWLQGAGELATIYITTLVLMSQRHKDELSELREQLTLEIAIMTEQKGAKIIALIEELRRDSPTLVNRIDHQAEAMATPADPDAVHTAFRETHEGLMATPAEADEAASGAGATVAD